MYNVDSLFKDILGASAKRLIGLVERKEQRMNDFASVVSSLVVAVLSLFDGGSLNHAEAPLVVANC